MATDAAIPEPSDALWAKRVVYAVATGITAYFINKMAEEIKGIKRRAGTNMGYMHALEAKVNGLYPVYTWGFPSSTDVTYLNTAEAWKYGETFFRK